MTAIKIAMGKIRKREDMLAIENNRENHPILNQIYDILVELYNQGKMITFM